MRKQVETSRARYDAACNAILALAEHGQMKFSECRAIAPQALRDRLDAARARLDAAEAAAIAKGKAYRGAFGMLAWSLPNRR
jgi:hypothetical protein